MKVAVFQNCVGGRTHNNMRHWVPGEFLDRLMWGNTTMSCTGLFWEEINQTRDSELPIPVQEYPIPF